MAVRSRWEDIPFERVSKATLSHCVFHSNNSDNSRALVDVLTITYVPRPLLKSISTRQNYTKFSKTIPILFIRKVGVVEPLSRKREEDIQLALTVWT